MNCMVNARAFVRCTQGQRLIVINALVKKKYESVSELAYDVGMDLSNLGRVVRELESHGIISLKSVGKNKAKKRPKLIADKIIAKETYEVWVV
jgi:predicted transcriptional regulator